MNMNLIMTHTLKLSIEACNYISSLSTNPLFSSISIIQILLFLYFPPILINLLISPVPIITSIILITLLHFGSHQTVHNPEFEPGIQPEKVVVCTGVSELQHPEFLPKVSHSFVEWDVKAPLEVIYEEYEGEEDPAENDPDPILKEAISCGRIERCTSLDFYYPDTDSESSSDGDFTAIDDLGSPENSFFRWEQEDGEGLIEIALDLHGEDRGMKVRQIENFLPEEDNMIEIDVSSARKDENLLLAVGKVGGL